MNSVLKRGFSRWLRRRRVAKHFGRHALLDTIAGRGPVAAAPAALASALLQVALDTPAAALARFDSHADGLSAREAGARLARQGPNEVEHEQPPPWWLNLWHCYANPFNLLLSVLAAVSWLGSDGRAATVIGVMVGLSTLVRFVQEGRSHRAAESLKTLVSNSATVLRRGPLTATTANQVAAATQAAAAPAQPSQVEVPIRRLVTGDLLLLSAGDMIPADCRLLIACDLFVAQSALTGESLPVEKFADVRGAPESALDQGNLVFLGTNVVSGSATALVVATGNRTYFGTLTTHASATERAPTAFQAGVNSVSWLLIRFAMVMVPIVLLVNGLARGDWMEAALFALSVAVGLTPEMLPMIVTSTLARGALALSRRKVVVKRLDAIQNFGAMDVLCTDKTGTLTQDKIALARHLDVYKRSSAEVLDFAFLNSFFQTGLKNLLDHAILDHVELPARLKLDSDYDKIDEIPFDFARRRMSVVVLERGLKHRLICKGAVEEMLTVCDSVRGEDGAVLPLDPAMLLRAQTLTRELNSDGLRVVAVATREMALTQTAYSVADETGLTLQGFIAFLDPPKESAAPALKALAAHGITVKVLSGDNDQVTARICAQVGLPAGTVLLGAQVDAMDDAALASAVEQHRMFAKLSPLAKERIVRALRAGGHVVGFMGDGINDAPALRAADIGISVDSGVDIAKEAADIILLEKSLMVLDEGVVLGRTTFCNMLKYIRMTASSNFGNVFSVLVASAFLPFLPMLPLQLLVQNLLYDISQTGIPFDQVDAELVQQPLKWNPADIGRFMLFFGPISSIFDLCTFVLMWRVFSADTVAEQALFQSGWFVVGLLTQTLVVHLIRTPKLPFIESRAAAPLLLMTLAIAALGIFLPMGPFAGILNFVPLPAAFFPWLAAILIAYCVLVSLMKRYYIHRFGWQ